MTTSTNRVVLNVTGYGSVFLGNLNESQIQELTKNASKLGISILRSEDDDMEIDYEYQYAYPNPREKSQKTDELIAASALDAIRVATNPKTTLYPSRCTVGRTEHKASLPKITKSLLESVSLEEAAANLIFFFPTFAELFSSNVISLMEKKRYLSEKDIESFSKKDKSALRASIAKLTTSLLSGNAKLRKSKVPRSLDIHLIEDDDDSTSMFVETEVPGSVGVSFLPNNSLVNPRILDTGERSFLTIVNSPSTKVYKYATRERYIQLTKNKKPKKEDIDAFYAHRVHSFDCVKGLINAALSPFRTHTCCTYSSEGCRTICLYASGGRYYAIQDLLQQLAKTPSSKQKDTEATEDDAQEEYTYDQNDPIAAQREAEGGSFEKEEGYNRMYTGFWHTAFIANPIYFIRLLIEAIKLHVVEHKVQLCGLSVKRMSQNLEGSDPIEILRKLPPSVRLNVYSDYVWEEICPDLFKIFNGNETFMGTEMDFVQFYDYTKVPGRWSRDLRNSISRKFKVPDPTPLYMLPSNYHITFSFSGTKTSYKQSIFASTYARQNSTVVFYSLDAASTVFDTLEKDAELIQDSDLRSFAINFKQRIKELRRSLRFTTRKVTGGVAKSIGLIPQEHDGFTVIDGDAYDLRFLDSVLAEQLGIDSLIVGLKYKEPTNLKIDIGSGYSVNPLTVAFFDQFVGTADFVQLRVGLGFESSKDAVSLVITPNELGVASIQNTLISFANENAEAFGTFDSLEKIVEFVNMQLKEAAIMSTISLKN